MVKCKMSGCQEQAEYGRKWGHKRYCVAHGTAYANKRDEYFKIQATLRQCECCGNKLTKHSHDTGEQLCYSCKQQQDEAVAAEREELRKRECETVRDYYLEECVSVADLSRWVREYCVMREL
jgi:hypothetical protein